jgi:hypothetical protein
MTDKFTHTPPPEDQYFRAILAVLKKKGFGKLRDQLAGGHCTIHMGDSASYKRWDATYTTVIFHLPLDEFDRFDSEDYQVKQTLIQVCGEIMPPEAGLDVMEIKFAPVLETSDEARTLEDGLLKIHSDLAAVSAQFVLPTDVLEKGKQMAEVYLYLYSVENYLRLFIESVGVQKYGPGYFNRLVIPRGPTNGIALRKEQEIKNQWIGVRGNSDLFYLDFKDLIILIVNNWDLFKPYFPDHAWISTKIDDLANCRNLVAHNSYIGDHERDVIRVNFNSIVKQLNPYMK